MKLLIINNQLDSCRLNQILAAKINEEKPKPKKQEPRYKAQGTRRKIQGTRIKTQEHF